MARGPLLAGMDSNHTRMCIGSLPDRSGVWIYEKDGKVYRALAQCRDQASAERIVSIRFKDVVELDLEKGIDADWGGTQYDPPKQHSSLLNGLL